LNAGALYTPVTLRQLLGLESSASNSELQDALGALATDNIDGAGCCNPVVQGMEEGIIMLPSGRNEVIWLAEDRKGNAAEATQIVNLRPLVSLSKDQTTVWGSTVSFAMVLNGPSPFYPLTVPFVIDEASTLSGADHDLVSGSVTFTEGQTRATVQVQFASGIGSADETLVVRLDDHTPGGEVLAAGYDPDNPDIHDINSGNKATHVITVVDRNLPPKASFVLQQAGANTLFITRDDGPVTVTANVIDPNPGDSHGFDWSGTDNILVDVGGDLDQGVLVFDPAYLSSGRYKVQVQVTDSEGATGTVAGTAGVLGRPGALSDRGRPGEVIGELPQMGLDVGGAQLLEHVSDGAVQAQPPAGGSGSPRSGRSSTFSPPGAPPPVGGASLTLPISISEPCAVASIRFIGGVPMKRATYVLAGSL
jgi:large repetitive protein